MRGLRNQITGPGLVIATVVCWGCLGTTALASNWTLGLQSGSSAESLSAGAPSAPTGIGSVCAPSQTVTVTWNPVASAQSYSIYQSTKSASSGYVAVASRVTAPSWTSQRLDRKTSYWFEVVAVVGTNWPGAISGYTGPRVFGPNDNCS